MHKKILTIASAAALSGTLLLTACSSAPATTAPAVTSAPVVTLAPTIAPVPSPTSSGSAGQLAPTSEASGNAAKASPTVTDNTTPISTAKPAS